MDLKLHLFLGFTVRLLFIVYSEWQDYYSEVQFTDIDYKVFSDGARNILAGKSPYDRHTYRYSPLLAVLVIPNISLFMSFGKILFSVIDIVISILIYSLFQKDGVNSAESTFYALFWVYNPMSIIISTRGNADTIVALLILSTLFFLKEKKYIYAGALHGLAIHFRLFPILFSLPIYISLKDVKKTSVGDLLFPTKNRFLLVFSCISTLISVTLLCYYYFGDKFLMESIVFHLKRSDIRHNYSVYFYTQYLGFDRDRTVMKVVMAFPQLVLLFVISFKFHSAEDLPFCEFCIAFVLVMYNSVLTCQYFIWYLCLFPFCLKNISIYSREVLFGCLFWIISQVAWLLPAYLLEFKFWNTFLWIWFQGILFFSSNIYILSIIIKSYQKKYKVI